MPERGGCSQTASNSEACWPEKAFLIYLLSLPSWGMSVAEATLSLCQTAQPMMPSSIGNSNKYVELTSSKVIVLTRWQLLVEAHQFFYWGHHYIRQTLLHPKHHLHSISVHESSPCSCSLSSSRLTLLLQQWRPRDSSYWLPYWHSCSSSVRMYWPCFIRF